MRSLTFEKREDLTKSAVAPLSLGPWENSKRKKMSFVFFFLYWRHARACSL